MDRRGDAKSREMMLDELLGYDHVTIQCHDNPDADAIASGYGLYCFFRDKGKDTRLLYSGRNKVRKANLMLMVEKLHIPLEYQPQMEDTVDGLLITVDCQPDILYFLSFSNHITAFISVSAIKKVRRIMYTRPIFLTRQAFNCFDAVPCTGLLRNIIR